MKNFKKQIEELNLSYKKEILRLCLINGFIIATALTINILYFQLCIAIISFFFIIIFNLFYIKRYSSIKTKRQAMKKIEFVSMLSYFRIFLNNGYNIYRGFEECKQYVSDSFKEDIDYFLKEVDNDKSIQPYIAFAHQFNSPLYEQVMMSIYQMVDMGIDNNYLYQFNTLLSRMRKETLDEKLNAQLSKLDSMSMFPLIGAGIIMIILAFGIILIVGELISGF